MEIFSWFKLNPPPPPLKKQNYILSHIQFKVDVFWFIYLI